MYINKDTFYGAHCHVKKRRNVQLKGKEFWAGSFLVTHYTFDKLKGILCTLCMKLPTCICKQTISEHKFLNTLHFACYTYCRDMIHT